MLKLFNICSYIGRGTTIPNSYKSQKGELHQFTFSDILQNGSISLNEKLRYSVNDEKILKKLSYVEKNDMIFPELIRDNIDIKMIGDTLDKGFSYSSRIIYVRVNKELYNSVFLSMLLRSDKLQKRLKNEVYVPSNGYKGVSQIRIESLRNFEIPFISLEQQAEIMKKEQMKRKKIEELTKELNNLYNL